MSFAGAAAWSGSWNLWATPGIAGYGVLPLLLLPAGIMCLSAGVVTSLGDLATKPLVAIPLLPFFAGFFVGAAITIPGFFVLLFWTPKRMPDRIRPRWLPPTWTPPENSFSSISRPFATRELRQRRPPSPYWPAKLVEHDVGPAHPGARYGFLAIHDAAITWFDCAWDTPESNESFTLATGRASGLEIAAHPAYKLLHAPIVVSINTPETRFRIDVFTGIGAHGAKIAASMTVGAESKRRRMTREPAESERAVRRGPNGELEVFAARRRLGRAALGCVAMTGLCLWLLLLATPTTYVRSELLIKGVGAAGTALFGFGSAALLARAIGHRPLVTVSDDGILDAESLFRLPIVRWSEVAGVEIEEDLGTQHLRVRLHDPISVINRCRSPISRAVYRWGLRHNQPVVSVSQTHAAIPLDELKAAIEARLP